LEKMRVVAGEYKGRLLRSVRGQDVRPTSDRLRETLFNILAPRIRGTRFLDLCAGSGAIGIEALSRGSSNSIFVDRSRSACSVIRQNLASVGIEGEAAVLCRDAISAVRSLAGQGSQFDIIFFDPPYAGGIYAETVNAIGKTRLLAEDGILVVEHRAKAPPELDFEGLEMYRQVKQGDSALTFARWKTGELEG
jgi:16S rRNA (guanine(966)-N(2))-methyltransferase RsmD